MISIDTMFFNCVSIITSICFIDELPERVISALNNLYPTGYENYSERLSIAEKSRGIAVEEFSWDGIANRLLE
jgi:hypothetical protein